MEVKIYTDGAARGNPDGPGGYGAVLTYLDASGKLYKKEISAGYRKTTNNRMELMAVIRSLQELTNIRTNVRLCQQLSSPTSKNILLKQLKSDLLPSLTSQLPKHIREVFLHRSL